MDYEGSYNKFEEVLQTFSHDRDVQLMLIVSKLNNFIESYDKETREEAKSECIAFSAKLNSLYKTILMQKARETLGVVYAASADEVRWKKNMLLKKHSAFNSEDNVRMYSAVIRAFDILDFY